MTERKFTEEEIKAKIKEQRRVYSAKYYKENREKCIERVREYRRRKALKALEIEAARADNA